MGVIGAAAARERARVFDAGATLVGVQTEAADSRSRPDEAGERGDAGAPVALLLNAGMVHRVGPSRAWVRLARRLAALGLGSVRFDHSGIGDSAARADRLPWERSTVAEARAVMDALAAEGHARFLLIGLCSGAITSFKAACEDERVVGAALINAQALDLDPEWNRHVLNRGWSRDYWQGSFRRPSSWWRALTGRVQYRRLFSVLGRQLRQRLGASHRVEAVTAELGGRLRGLTERGVELLFVDSEGDHAQDYSALVLADAPRSPRLAREVIAGSDHTFTRRADQERLFAVIEDWIRSRWMRAGAERADG